MRRNLTQRRQKTMRERWRGASVCELDRSEKLEGSWKPYGPVFSVEAKGGGEVGDSLWALRSGCDRRRLAARSNLPCVVEFVGHEYHPDACSSVA